jgi:transposase
MDFVKWFNKLAQESLEVHITMEATGVYHENLAYDLDEELNVVVHILLPNIAKKYFESLNVKVKTDKVDSEILARLGLERQLDTWVLTSKYYRTLRFLNREKEHLNREKTMIKNQLHASIHSANGLKKSENRQINRVKYIENQIKSVEADIKKAVSKDEFLVKKIEKITTIPGVGFATAVGIIAETGGFATIKSIKQLTSYAGYDVVIKESGTSVKAKTRISKKGNSHIRHLLHMPSLTSIRHSATHKNTFERMVNNKDKKMIGVVAIQRKLLGLIYTLWKNDTTYIENYQNTKLAA